MAEYHDHYAMARHVVEFNKTKFVSLMDYYVQTIDKMKARIDYLQEEHERDEAIIKELRTKAHNNEPVCLLCKAPKRLMKNQVCCSCYKSLPKCQTCKGRKVRVYLDGSLDVECYYCFTKEKVKTAPAPASTPE